MGYKVHIGEDNPPNKSFLHVKTFETFQSLIKSSFEEIELLHFGTSLDEPDDLFEIGIEDLGVVLIQQAKTRPIPQCIVNNNQKYLIKTINNYLKVYNYTNYCIEKT